MAVFTEISRDELQEKLERKNGVQVVNVLEPKYWNLGKIKGSKHIPLSQLDERVHEIDKSREIVTYCAGYGCSASKQAAELLAQRGFKVQAYEGGIKEWSEAGLPVDKETAEVVAEKKSGNCSCP